MDQDFMNDCLLKSSIHFLHNAASAMPNNVPVLKSIYSCKSRILELRSKMYLPADMTKSTIMCPKCCIQLSEGHPNTVIIKPEKKLSKFAKKMLKKQEEGGKFTRFQLLYLEKLKNPGCNEMVTVCKFCKTEIKVPLKKPFKAKPSKIQNPKVQNLKRKRKNRRDKLCGLRKPVEESTEIITIEDTCEKIESQSFKTMEFIPLSRQSTNNNIQNKKKPNKPSVVRESNAATRRKQMLNNKKQKKMQEKMQAIFNKGNNANKNQSKLKQFLKSL